MPNTDMRPDTPDAPDALAMALALEQKSLELDALRSELEETNRGVVALYAELDAQADQLRQATELKSRFLAYMSHEFRTPIASFQSLTRLLLDQTDGPLTAEQEKQIRFISDTASEFSDMVNDLLDLAKVEAGRVDVDADWFEMVDLFSALRGMFRPVLVNPDVNLVFEAPQNVPRLFADDRKLSQILRNFISNALKFTVHGDVRISAVLNTNATVTFAVADTGIGIATEAHAAIFQDFVQVDSPLQKRLRGTGLGLSLSKRLAELLGGSVGFSSELGKGSVFWVQLPVVLDPEAASSPPRPPPHD